ncbi:MAG: hypothetical protein WCO84_04185 [bacterium]
MFALIPSLVVFVVSYFVSMLSGNALIFSSILLMLAYVVTVPLSTSSVLFVVFNIEKDLSFSEIIKGGFSKILSVLWIMIISFFIISAGGVLFLIPGVIFSVWFSLSLSVLFGEDKKGMDALLVSRAYVDGYWLGVLWRSFVFGIFMFGVSTAVLIQPLILLSMFGFDTDRIISFAGLLSTPMSLIYTRLLYENIKRLKNGAVLQVGSKWSFIVVFLIGGILIPAIMFGGIMVGLFSILNRVNVNVDNYSSVKMNNETETSPVDFQSMVSTTTSAVDLIENTNIATTTEVVPQKINLFEDTTNWKTYTYKNYQFKYPSEWTVELINNSQTKSSVANFIFEGAVVGNLTCPIREIGYEGSEKDGITQNKKLTLNSSSVFDVTFDSFRGIGEFVGDDFSLIKMSPKTGSLQSCEIGISTGKYYSPTVAKNIFDSIKVVSND